MSDDKVNECINSEDEENDQVDQNDQLIMIKIIKK